MKYLVLLVCVVALSGCGELDESSEKAFKTLGYADHSSRNTSLRKKYFLIAGSRDNANFAQEIVEQKHLFLNLGAREDEMTCFYTIPSKRDFMADKAQYLSLTQELNHCYPASPKLIWEQMQDGKDLNAQSLYVYVSSHGSNPLSDHLKNPKLLPDMRNQLQAQLTAFPTLDQFYISLDATDSGIATSYKGRLDQLRNGIPATDIFFTPKHLKNTIRANFPVSTKKYIVIQGCYSGGFVDSDNETHRANSLRDLENVTAITASRYDRVSFGCNPGRDRTFFGGAYNDIISNHQRLPENLDWQAVYQQVNASVDSLERTYRSSHGITEDRPSLPMFFTNN